MMIVQFFVFFQELYSMYTYVVHLLVGFEVKPLCFLGSCYLLLFSWFLGKGQCCARVCLHVCVCVRVRAKEQPRY